MTHKYLAQFTGHGSRHTVTGFLAIPLWSLTPLLIVLIGPASAFFLMGFRYLISGIILSFASIIRGEGLYEQFKNPIGVWVLNCLGIFLSQVNYVYALQHAPTAEANFINYAWPIYVILLDAALNRSSITIRQWAAMALGMAGCGVILLSGETAALDWENAEGYALALSAGFLWAIYQVGMRKYYSEYKSSIRGAPFLLYAILCFALCYFTSQAPIQITAQNWPYLLVFGIIPVSYMLWEVGIKRGNIQLLSLCAYFIPLLSAVWIILATGQAWSWSLLVGGLLIVCAPILGGSGAKPKLAA